MSQTVPSVDREGREIEVGSVIRYWRTEGWYGGTTHEGLVTEIKPKSYVVRVIDYRTGWVGEDDRLDYVVVSANENRVNKSREDRYGREMRPSLVRTPAEQVAFMAENAAKRAQTEAWGAKVAEARNASYAAREAAEEKRREINNAINAAVEALKEKYRAEFEVEVATQYDERGISPADLDAADDYYNRAYTVRPDGFKSEVTV